MEFQFHLRLAILRNFISVPPENHIVSINSPSPSSGSNLIPQTSRGAFHTFCQNRRSGKDKDDVSFMDCGAPTNFPPIAHSAAVVPSPPPTMATIAPSSRYPPPGNHILNTTFAIFAHNSGIYNLLAVDRRRRLIKSRLLFAKN